MTTPGADAFGAGPTIVTLGSASLSASSPAGELASIGPGKPLAVLVYLTASPGRAASRDHLIDLLWADAEPEAARHGVRQTVWFLRRKLGADAITATRELVRLTADIESDRDRFLEAIETQAYADAVAIYRGDFLPNMAVPGGLRFEQWADVERQRLRGLFLRAGHSEVRRLLSDASRRDAIALARRVRNADPDAEGSWRLLIEAMLNGGDHLGAATEADALVRRLAAERVEPEPATQALIRAAHSSTPVTDAGANGHALSAELIGRAEEFAVLTSAWEDARAGRAVHLHVTALPGVGKTRLLGDFAARLRARRARVATIALRQGDRAIPYAALGELAAALARLPGADSVSQSSARTLVALNPTLSTIYPVEPGHAQLQDVALRRAVAIFELTAAVCGDAGLAVILDDLHWIDEASRQALASALQRLSSQSVLTVTAGRPGRIGLRTPATIEVWLRPLTESNVTALVASLGAVPDEPWADELPARLHEATGGVPLLVLEMLQLLVDHGALELNDSTWSSPSPPQLEETLATRSALAERVGALSGAEGSVLTMIAAAGTPLSEDELAALLHMPQAELGAHVAALEQRGLLASTSGGWRVTHDSIADVATKLPPADRLREAHRELGDWFFARAANDSDAWLRASSHFARIADARAVARCFVNWLALARRRGDPRPALDLAVEFIGPQAEVIRPAALVRAAPLHLRFSRPRRVAIIAASLVIAASAIAFALRPSAAVEPPDATLYAFSTDSGKRTSARIIDLRESELGRADMIELQHGRSSRAIDLPDPQGTTLSPDGRAWASRRIFSDSGGLDLVITQSRSGAEHRITYSPGDDYAPDWSPDGKYLVFSTSRFSTRGHPDLAIVDVSTGVVRQLTHGPESDDTPRWHPSGTEIAFVRRDWSTGRNLLCVITVDARRLDCSVYGSLASLSVRGWYDWHRVVVVAGSAVPDSATLVTIDVENHDVRPLLTGRVTAAELSPDGRWIACLWAAGQQLPLRWIVFPIARPDLSREVVADRLGERQLSLVWLGALRSHGFLSTLEIVTAAGTLPLTAGSKLGAIALDDSGGARVPAPLTWTSLTPAIATIDSVSGVLIPHAAGRALIRLSAGGWLTADTTVRIDSEAAPLVLVEDWTKGIGAQFAPFGAPAPSVVNNTAVGATMRNNGDGSFSSGVYSRKEYVGAAGLGVEAVVSTPVDSLQWQTLSLEFRPGMDSTRLARWDHRDSEMPRSPDAQRVGRCQVAIPAGEGVENVHTISLADIRLERLAVDARYFSGRPYRVRIQLFPDGRCGVAIDGKPLSIVPGLPLDSSRYRLVIAGNSAQTDILVGEVRMWTGVPSDIRWLDLDLRPPNGGR